MLNDLFQAEVAGRGLHSIHFRPGQTRLPLMKHPDNYLFGECSVDEHQIRSLYEGDLLEPCMNLMSVAWERRNRILQIADVFDGLCLKIGTI